MNWKSLKARMSGDHLELIYIWKIRKVICKWIKYIFIEEIKMKLKRFVQKKDSREKGLASVRIIY